MKPIPYATILAGLFWLSGCGASSAPASQESQGSAAPESGRTPQAEDGTFTADAGDLALRLHSSACEEFVDSLTMCNKDNELAIESDDGSIRQTLTPDSVFVDRNKLIYRGSLSGKQKPDAHTFVLSDINGDGKDDFLVWTGREGAYGGPSYDVYLFDSGKRKFTLSQSFSDLTLGRVGLFGVDNDRITASAVDGCCLHVFETYLIESNEPKLIERVTEDSSSGKKRTKTERLEGGEMREVQ
jgi:hypothetical protein